MNFIIKTFLFCIILAICYTNERKPDPDAIIFRDDSDEDQPNIQTKINVHHHHHYHPMFQQENTQDETTFHPEVNNNQIPLELIKQLNQIENISDLLQNFIEGEEAFVQELTLTSRFGNVERAAAVIPKSAGCKTSSQVVELASSNDSSLFYYPSCTRVERCSGCCLHSLLSCQAIQTETLSYQVIVSQYAASGKLKYKDKEIVFVEQHTKCKCDCILKAEDCNNFQRYDQNSCQCICNNVDEKRKCEMSNNTKLWDPSICKCRCRKITECSTGLYFDENKCICTAAIRRRFAEFSSSIERDFTDKESYNVDPLSVYPLTKSKPTQK